MTTLTDNLKEDSQIDFSMDNIFWTLAGGGMAWDVIKNLKKSISSRPKNGKIL